jgi:hypothetical protein
MFTAYLQWWDQHPWVALLIAGVALLAVRLVRR